MFKLYFLTYIADVVASVTLNYQLIQNSLEFENLIFFYLKIERVQILKNNI
jgi:phage-related holin